MSEEQNEQQSEQQGEVASQEEVAQQENSGAPALKLNGLFAFKIGMTTIYAEDGTAIPVTALKYDPLVVTQLKTKEKDGYESIQVSFKQKPVKNSNGAEQGHLKRAGLKNMAFYFSKEILQAHPEGIAVGQQVAIESFEKGEFLKVTSKSKGRGFSGVVRRHGFAGGPASHGSKFHRGTGSVGMRTEPGRIIKGKKMPGQYGNKQITVRNAQVVDVIPDESILLIKGTVPGAMNTLVKLVKEG